LFEKIFDEPVKSTFTGFYVTVEAFLGILVSQLSLKKTLGFQALGRGVHLSQTVS
jgi:hypothetical protein